MFRHSLLLAFATVGVYAAPHVRQSCADVTVIFARGTLEAAPIGSIVGPPFQSALQTALTGQTLSFQGVDYPANIAGFLEGGDPAGSITMANDVTSTASSCPNTKIVMAGYSQGAQLVHNAAKQLSTSVQNRVDAVVVFGDPDDNQGFPGVLNARSLTFCNQGDNICAGGDLILPAHLTYGQNAPAAAAFVAGKV
ncbi:cutA, cutinase A [Crassisporium funariophilum]|nr:cutA, cutinase A [Crassisporium funariophilum]